MPNWAIHLLVPLLVLFIVGRKEDYKYILLLLPFAVLPDIDTFATEHRALLHNVFIPLALVLMGLSLKKMRTLFFITAFYLPLMSYWICSAGASFFSIRFTMKWLS